MKYYLKLLSLPLFFTALFTSLFLIWEILALPPADELAALLEGYFDTYGLSVLFLSSIVEGMLLVGNYFPGVFVIFLGVIAAGTPGEATLAVAVVTVGLLLAHVGNYALGRYGWYRLLVRFGLKNAIERAREDVIQKGPTVILSSYWLPSVGALTDTAAGILQMSPRTFFSYSLASTVLWNAIAGVLVYSFKDLAFTLATPGTSGMGIMYGILMLWMLWLVAADLYRKKSLLS